jgi:Ca2+-binding EF-hand superfamily protein/predicted ferric reductase
MYVTLQDFTENFYFKEPFLAQRLFSFLDKDRSGYLSLREFINGLEVVVNGNQERKMEFLFRVFDIDGDGHIDYNEMRMMLKCSLEESPSLDTEETVDDLAAFIFKDADTDGSGDISFEELKGAFKRNENLFKSLSMSTSIWIKPKFINKNRKNTFLRLIRDTVINRRAIFIFWSVYILINIVCMVFAYCNYYDKPGWLICARVFGNSLNFNCALVLVLVLRKHFTWLRTKGGCSVLPLDDFIELHKKIGLIILVESLIHTIAHLFNLYYTCQQNPLINYWNALFTFELSIGYPTGVFELLLHLLILLFSMSYVRKRGFFQLFYWLHMLNIPWLLVMLVHARHLYKWLIIPAICYAIEKILRYRKIKSNKFGDTFIEEVLLLPSKVTHLVIRKPPKFTFKPGDYIFINIPIIAKYEWHPFSISSAPEKSDYIWLHVRAVGNWTKKLYSYASSTNFDVNSNNSTNQMSYLRMSMRSRMSKSFNTNGPLLNINNYGFGNDEKFDKDQHDESACCHKADCKNSNEKDNINPKPKKMVSFVTTMNASSKLNELLKINKTITNSKSEPADLKLLELVSEEQKQETELKNGNEKDKSKIQERNKEVATGDMSQKESDQVKIDFGEIEKARSLEDKEQFNSGTNPVAPLRHKSILKIMMSEQMSKTASFNENDTINAGSSLGVIVSLNEFPTESTPKTHSHSDDIDLDESRQDASLFDEPKKTKSISNNQDMAETGRLTQKAEAIIAKNAKALNKLIALKEKPLMKPRSKSIDESFSTIGLNRVGIRNNEQYKYKKLRKMSMQMQVKSLDLEYHAKLDEKTSRNVPTFKNNSKDDNKGKQNEESELQLLNEHSRPADRKMEKIDENNNTNTNSEKKNTSSAVTQSDDNLRVEYKNSFASDEMVVIPLCDESNSKKKEKEKEHNLSTSLSNYKNDILGYLKMYKRATRITLNTIGIDQQWRLKIFVDGPYGTPSQQIFDAEHAVLIAAGIGITPFASILQSMMHRYRRARAICPNCKSKICDDNYTSPGDKLNVKKVDFIWITREQRSLEWFISLLSQVEIEQRKNNENFLDTHLYVTSARRQSDLKSISLHLTLDAILSHEESSMIEGLRQRTHYGRPNWDIVMQSLIRKQKGKITVFYCGIPSLANILQEKCKEYGLLFKKEIF